MSLEAVKKACKKLKKAKRNLNSEVANLAVINSKIVYTNKKGRSIQGVIAGYTKGKLVVTRCAGDAKYYSAEGDRRDLSILVSPEQIIVIKGWDQ